MILTLFKILGVLCVVVFLIGVVVVLKEVYWPTNWEEEDRNYFMEHEAKRWKK